MLIDATPRSDWPRAATRLLHVYAATGTLGRPPDRQLRAVRASKRGNRSSRPAPGVSNNAKIVSEGGGGAAVYLYLSSDDLGALGVGARCACAEFPGLPSRALLLHSNCCAEPTNTEGRCGEGRGREGGPIWAPINCNAIRIVRRADRSVLVQRNS